MGTASFSVTRYAKTKGSGAATIQSSIVTTSGAHTSSGTASNIDDASGDITMSAGQVLEVYASQAMRIRFGGVAATSTTGHYIPAGVQKQYECEEAGTVSIIDV